MAAANFDPLVLSLHFYLVNSALIVVTACRRQTFNPPSAHDLHFRPCGAGYLSTLAFDDILDGML
jgi:hypothetical protein